MGLKLMAWGVLYLSSSSEMSITSVAAMGSAGRASFARGACGIISLIGVSQTVLLQQRPRLVFWQLSSSKTILVGSNAYLLSS